MRFAVSLNNLKIDAVLGDTNQIKKDSKHLKCPECEAKVIYKNGKIKTQHFAHSNKTKCWNSNQMSVWHTNWQNKFPVDYMERVITVDNVKHRADIAKPNKDCFDYIIEFQHSSISVDDFTKRNEFYSQICPLIWVFDSERFESFSVTLVEFGKYMGENISVLRKDKGYVNWCKNQSDLVEKYPYILDTDNVYFTCQEQVVKNVSTS